VFYSTLAGPAGRSRTALIRGSPPGGSDLVTCRDLFFNKGTETMTLEKYNLYTSDGVVRKQVTEVTVPILPGDPAAVGSGGISA
jgi:hypothetical protein